MGDRSEFSRFFLEFKNWLLEVEEEPEGPLEEKSNPEKGVKGLKSNGEGIKGTAVLEGDKFTYLDEEFSRLVGYREPDRLMGENLKPFLRKNKVSPREVLDKVEKEGSWVGEISFTGENGKEVCREASLKKAENGSIICHVSSSSWGKEAPSENSQEDISNLRQGLEKLHTLESEGEICKHALQIVDDVLEYDFCFLRIREDGLVFAKENFKDRSYGIESVNLERKKLSEQVHRKGEASRVDDLSNYSGFESGDSPLRSYLGVPIGKLGTVQVVSSVKGNFDDRDVDILKILANNLRERIKRTRLEGKLSDQAVRDQLTGLFNRHYLKQVLNKESERAQRYGHRLAFLMIDINNFKDINDFYSHKIGDEVLVKVGNLLQENVREADTVIRYGGDEFLILLPETGEGVESVIPRLKESIRRWSEETDIIEIPLTLAIGSSHFSPEEEIDAEKAIAKADEDMFEDKEGK